MHPVSQSVLFVCLGNICRSPLAEAVFLHLVKEKAIQEQFVVDSAGTGNWHVGEKADSRMRQTGRRHGITLQSIGRQFRAEDYHIFDYIVAMDKKNRYDILKIAENGSQSESKPVYLLRDFDEEGNRGKDVPDPWFGSDHDFENVFQITERCCRNLLDFILEEASRG